MKLKPIDICPHCGVRSNPPSGHRSVRLLVADHPKCDSCGKRFLVLTLFDGAAVFVLGTIAIAAGVAWYVLRNVFLAGIVPRPLSCAVLILGGSWIAGLGVRDLLRWIKTKEEASSGFPVVRVPSVPQEGRPPNAEMEGSAD
jgi:uncharacterized protein (DUF983 family)